MRDAVAIYDALGKAPSRAAAQATLASVHQLRGETDLARECLERGLAFWREDGHPRWTERFEERLARL